MIFTIFILLVLIVEINGNSFGTTTFVELGQNGNYKKYNVDVSLANYAAYEVYCSKHCDSSPCGFLVVQHGIYMQASGMVWLMLGNLNDAFANDQTEPMCMAFLKALGDAWDYSECGSDANYVSKVIQHALNEPLFNTDPMMVSVLGYSSGGIQNLRNSRAFTKVGRFVKAFVIYGSNNQVGSCDWMHGHLLMVHGDQDHVVRYGGTADTCGTPKIITKNGKKKGCSVSSTEEYCAESCDVYSRCYMRQAMVGLQTWPPTNGVTEYHGLCFENGSMDTAAEDGLCGQAAAANCASCFPESPCSDSTAPLHRSTAATLSTLDICDPAGAETDVYKYQNCDPCRGSVEMWKINNWNHDFPNRRVSAYGETVFWREVRKWLFAHTGHRPSACSLAEIYMADEPSCMCARNELFDGCGTSVLRYSNQPLQCFYAEYAPQACPQHGNGIVYDTSVCCQNAYGIPTFSPTPEGPSPWSRGPSRPPTPGPTQSPTAGAASLCDADEVLSPSVAAGYSCLVGNAPVGDSHAGFDLSQCTGAGGTWTAYDCNTANQHLIAQGGYSWEHYGHFKDAWGPICCGNGIPAPTPATLICNVGQVMALGALAGYSCIGGNSNGGDSHVGTTQNQCTSGGGVWTPYDCETAEGYLGNMGGASYEYYDVMKGWWNPSCCAAAPTNPPPTPVPTKPPTLPPTKLPTNQPSHSPTGSPSLSPSFSPTMVPSNSDPPTFSPTFSPTGNPTCSPTRAPTHLPTTVTAEPTIVPSTTPVFSPTNHPTGSPTLYPTHCPTFSPTGSPTLNPTHPHPTNHPTFTNSPTFSPTIHPTGSPTLSPTHPHPTNSPTSSPTFSPTTTPQQIYSPTFHPTSSPTMTPTSTMTPTNAVQTQPPYGACDQVLCGGPGTAFPQNFDTPTKCNSAYFCAWNHTESACEPAAYGGPCASPEAYQCFQGVSEYAPMMPPLDDCRRCDQYFCGGYGTFDHSPFQQGGSCDAFSECIWNPSGNGTCEISGPPCTSPAAYECFASIPAYSSFVAQCNCVLDVHSYRSNSTMCGGGDVKLVCTDTKNPSAPPEINCVYDMNCVSSIRTRLYQDGMTCSLDQGCMLDVHSYKSNSTMCGGGDVKLVCTDMDNPSAPAEINCVRDANCVSSITYQLYQENMTCSTDQSCDAYFCGGPGTQNPSNFDSPSKCNSFAGLCAYNDTAGHCEVTGGPCKSKAAYNCFAQVSDYAPMMPAYAECERCDQYLCSSYGTFDMDAFSTPQLCNAYATCMWNATTATCNSQGPCASQDAYNCYAEIPEYSAWTATCDPFPTSNQTMLMNYWQCQVNAMSNATHDPSSCCADPQACWEHDSCLEEYHNVDEAGCSAMCDSVNCVWWNKDDQSGICRIISMHGCVQRHFRSFLERQG